MSAKKNDLFIRSYQGFSSDSYCRRGHPEDITTLFDIYEFVNMSFGLRNAAQTFQSFIDGVLEGLEFCYAYIDDILVASSSREEHYEHLKLLLSRLEEYGVVINPAKCVFGQEEVKFCYYLISREGIRPIFDRVKAILEYKNYKLQRTYVDI